MAVSKSAEAFRTISEAANELDVPQHVLRHWEEVFGQIRPMRRAGGRRYYRPLDIDILRGVRVLLYEERFTTKGVQKIFKENGVKYIAELGRLAAAGRTVELRPSIREEAGDMAPPREENPFRRAAEGGRSAEGETGGAQPAGAGEGLSPEMRAILSDLLARLEHARSSVRRAREQLDAITEPEAAAPKTGASSN